MRNAHTSSYLTVHELSDSKLLAHQKLSVAHGSRSVSQHSFEPHQVPGRHYARFFSMKLSIVLKDHERDWFYKAAIWRKPRKLKKKKSNLISGVQGNFLWEGHIYVGRIVYYTCFYLVFGKEAKYLGSKA